MDNQNINEHYRRRTKVFAIQVIHLVENLPETTTASVLGKQLLRSATSVAANYRAMCMARSSREKYAKLCLVVEEADESLFWLELLSEGLHLNHADLIAVQNEALELAKLFTAYRYRLKP